MAQKIKDFISTYYVSQEIFMAIFSRASFFKKKGLEITYNNLKGKNIVNAFFEPSTRTRFSFEIAEKKLGANVINFSSQTSSISKGESFSDTVKTLESIGADLIVVRHPQPGSAKFIADTIEIPVVNGGDGSHEHPTQALLDLFTIYELKKTFNNQKIVLVGDILHSRSVRSTIFAIKSLGGTLVLSGPPPLVPEYYKQLGVEINYNLDDALKGAIAVKTARIQKERFSQFYIDPKEYFDNYRLDNKRISKCRQDLIVMHGAPMRRGEEITSEVADGKNSVIFEEMQNGMFIRMALLDLILSKGEKLR